MNALGSEIEIGAYTFSGVIACTIDKSTGLIGNTATIELPLSAVYENKTRLNIANEIKRGDKVTIKLGYDGNNEVEFNGYVLSVGATDKTIIKCEDLSYLLRNNTLVNKLFVKNEGKLSTIVDYILSGTSISLSNKLPEMTIDGFLIKNMTSIQALQKLKNDYGLSIFFDKDDKLYIGLAYTYFSGDIEFDLQQDLPADGNKMDFKVADDVKLKIKAISILKDNEKIEVETGDKDGDTRTLYFNGITDKAKLTELANDEIKKYKYTGYDGSVTTFGEKLSLPGMSAKITDKTFPAREGTYYIEGVKITFGGNGFRRINTLGIKI